MKKIPLHGKYGQGKFALVDDEDYEKVSWYKWYVSYFGYVVTKIKGSKGKNTWIHKLIINSLPRVDIDHKNRNKLDNRKRNLRLCERWQNNANSKKRPGVSKYKGVSLHHTGKWHTRVYIFRKPVLLGNYKDEREAAYVYDQVAIQLFGEFAHTNFKYD